MTEPTTGSNAATISRDELHEALVSLYDIAGLGMCVLADRFPEVGQAQEVEQRGMRLRSLLLNAIEVMRPLRRYPFGSLESRAYDVLSLRYVEDMTARQVGNELSLSERQVHRDLWAAESKLLAVLNTRLATGSREAAPEPGNVFQDELEAFRSQPVVVDLGQTVETALELVRPLAEKTGTTVEPVPRDWENVKVLVDEAVLRQMLAQVLSVAIQQSGPEPVEVQVAGGDFPSVVISFTAVEGIEAAHFADVSLIAQAQGAEVSLETGTRTGETRVSLQLRSGIPRSVLVVEDNPGVLELYRRYLLPARWQVHGASDPRLALEMALRVRPDVIVLDIMLPHLDGWSVLKALAGSPITAGIPVVVCSIVQDSSLSRSLGARAHLMKPVSRGALLAALSGCLTDGEPGE